MVGDLDASRIESASCEVEWPPKSGRLIRVAEVDRAEWFTLDDARDKIIKDKASFSIAWNKSCGRCHRSEGRLYPSSSG
jgi:predicted NUDIX family NTP pyrophosphohydrolase